MILTGTHISYCLVCHRKLWLFSHEIRMEHTSDLVAEGKLIHESTYPQRSERYQELEIDGIKIDYYDARNKVIHEVKKSDKLETAHEWQVKYYIYVLERNGIEGVTGIIEYPKLRHTTEILLSNRDKEELESMITEVGRVMQSEFCPDRIKRTICKSCSYEEFCWCGEEEES